MSSNEFGDPPWIERVQRRGPALVAPLDKEPRGGVERSRVRRTRLGAEPSKVQVDEAGVDRPGLELGAAHQRAQESEIGLRPDDDGVVELLCERGQRLGAARAMDDHLGDHRIVEGRDAVAGLEAGVDPDAGQAFLALEVHDVDTPGRGQKAVLRVLGVDARFDRRARAADLALLERQRLASGDPELPFDQVEAGHCFGHRMLDLKPRVHLEEVEVAGPQSSRRVDDEFDRARADIARGQRRIGRGPGHCGARLLGQSGRRTFLDHLLMAALGRAVALVEVDASAVAVSEHLHFDMAGRGDIFLDHDPPVAERGLGLADSAFERGVEFDMRVDPPHAAPAPARDRLDEHRIADLIGLFAQEFRGLVVAVIAGHDRHAGALHQRLGRAFEAHRPHRLGRRPDEDDFGLAAGFGEAGVLGQKAVAWMQALRADFLRKRDDGVLIEIAVGALANLVRFVGEPGKQGPAVGGRVHGDRADSHCPRGPNDPAGDLAAIGDEDVGEHVEAPRRPCLVRDSVRRNPHRLCEPKRPRAVADLTEPRVPRGPCRRMAG